MTDAPWINEETKSVYHKKNSLYQRQIKSGSIDYTSLKLVFAVLYQIFIFSPNDSP